MKREEHGLVVALLAGMALSGLLLVTGCEVSGHYQSDDVDVQFGNTNAATQVQTQ